MAVRLSVSPDAIDIFVEGIDRLWGLRTRLELPLARVLEAKVVPAHWARGDLRVRTGGLSWPGRATVGHFRGRCAKRQWWRVYRSSDVLLISLRSDSQFERIVLETDDPAADAARINDLLVKVDQ